MKAIFILVAVSGLLYFSFVKRRFDYFGLAYFSALVYFMPGFFGFTSYHVEGSWSDTRIHPETYGIMISVLISIVFSAWLSSSLRVMAGFSIGLSPRAAKLLPGLLMVITIGSFLALLSTTGGELFSLEKESVMESLNRWHILFYTAATLGLPISYVMKRRLLFTFFFLFLLCDLFIGFRAALSVAVLSVLTLILYERGAQRLILVNLKIVVVALLFGILVFGYKIFAFAIKAGAWDLVANILTTPDSYVLMFTHSEPFVTQEILNEVVSHRFESTGGHILSSLYQFILFAPELGAEPVTFNSLFQPVLFPDVDYGLAANIWAQMWSVGGWGALVLFIIIFNFILVIGNATLQSRSLLIRTGMAPAFCYWAFYLHRNEFGYALNLEKRQVLLFLCVVFLAYFIDSAFRRQTAIGRN